MEEGWRVEVTIAWIKYFSRYECCLPAIASHVLWTVTSTGPEKGWHGCPTSPFKIIFYFWLLLVSLMMLLNMLCIVYSTTWRYLLLHIIATYIKASIQIVLVCSDIHSQGAPGIHSHSMLFNRYKLIYGDIEGSAMDPNPCLAHYAFQVV